VVSVAAKTISPDKLVLIAPAVGKFAVENVPDDTLVIHGEEDDVVLLTDVYDWARPQHLPLIVFPGAGHFFHGDLIRLQNVVRKQCADLT
jgi:alpha/beta superfamily hydrolase